MTDKELVKKLIAKDNDAWKIFFRKYNEAILKRIKQVFYRYSFQYSGQQLQEAHDRVLDHIIFGKALPGFKNEVSLSAFIRTVTTNSTLDWYRAQRNEKNMYGVGDVEVSKQTDTRESDEKESVFGPLDLDLEERIYLACMIIAFQDLSLEEFRSLLKINKKSSEDTEQILSSVKQKIEEKNEKTKDKFSKETSQNIRSQVEEIIKNNI